MINTYDDHNYNDKCTYKDHVKNYFEPLGMCAGLESMATSRIVLAMLKIKFRFHVIP